MREAIEIREDGDNPLRFTATSGSRSIVHTVDLAAWAGNGSCSCEHFEFRLLPRLRDRRASGMFRATATESTRCSHILAARRAFTDQMIARIAEVMSNARSYQHDEE